MGETPVFEPGSLRRLVAAVSARALAAGDLLPIPTACEFIEDGGVRFFVRVLASLARKDEARATQRRDAGAAKPANPFLPYEEALFVANVSASHVAILNKFNVVDHHLLIVTRQFQDQRALLTLRDFEAWWRCLWQYVSLGFYNGGVEAGASQTHKHLQLVPLPLAPADPAVPIEPLLEGIGAPGEVAVVPGFGFRHAFGRLDTAAQGDAAALAAYRLYAALLQRAGLRPPGGAGGDLQSGPYCLVATREWLLLVPRSREFFAGVSINALGFAGALLVRDEAQLQALREAGPLTALRETALPGS